MRNFSRRGLISVILFSLWTGSSLGQTLESVQEPVSTVITNFRVKPLSLDSEVDPDLAKLLKIDAKKSKDIFKALRNFAEQKKDSVVIVNGYEGRKDYQQLDLQSAGFLYSKDSQDYVVMTYHAKITSSRLEVVYRNKRKEAAVLVGQDARTDIVTLKVQNADRFPPLPLSQTPAKLGQFVIVIGHPLKPKPSCEGVLPPEALKDLKIKCVEPKLPEHAKTAAGNIFYWDAQLGIISHPDLDIVEPSGKNTFHMMALDAPLHHGNSGGPIIDLQGEVVGMVDGIVPQTEQSCDGFKVVDKPHLFKLGFGIPSDTIANVMPLMLQNAKDGQISLTWTGFQLASEGFDKPVLVSYASKSPDSPALGLIEAGDIVLGIDGRDFSATIVGRKMINPATCSVEQSQYEVSSLQRMQDYTYSLLPGQKAIFKIQRGEQILDIPITTKPLSGKRYR